MFRICENLLEGFTNHNEYMNCHWKSIQTFEFINENTIIFSKVSAGLFIYSLMQKKEFELRFFNSEIKTKIIAIAVGKENVHYCLDELGSLYEVNTNCEIFEKVKQLDNVPMGLVRCEMKKEIYVYDVSGNLYIFNTTDKSIHSFKLTQNIAVIAVSMSENDNELYFADENRNLYTFNLKSEQSHKNDTFNSVIRSIEPINKELLLLGTSNGHVLTYNINNGEIIFDQYFHKSTGHSSANVSKLVDVKLLDHTRAVSIGWNKKVVVFNFKNGSMLQEFSIDIPSALRISPQGKIGISECTYYDSHDFLKYRSNKEVIKPVTRTKLPMSNAKVFKYVAQENLYVVAADNRLMFFNLGFEMLYYCDIPHHEDIEIQAIEYMRWGKLVVGDNYGFVHIYSIHKNKIENTINTINMNAQEFQSDIFYMELMDLSVAPYTEKFVTLLTAMPNQSLDGLTVEELEATYFSKLLLWDGKTGEMIHDFSEKNTFICQAELISSSVLVYANHRGKIKIFDIEKNIDLGEYRTDSGLISSGLQKRFCYAYSYPNYQLFSFGQTDGLVAYSLATKELSMCSKKHNEMHPNIIRCNSRMNQIYLGFNQSTSSFVKVFDMDSKCELFTIEGFRSSINEIHVVEEEKRIVISEGNRTTVWSNKGVLLYELEMTLRDRNFQFINRNGLVIIEQDHVNVFDLRNEDNILYKYIVDTSSEELALLIDECNMKKNCFYYRL